MLQLLGGDGQLHTDIELSDGNLDAESGELPNVLLDICGHGADDEMGLETDTVDGRPDSFERLDEPDYSRGFGAQTIDVVVVDLSKSSLTK